MTSHDSIYALMDIFLSPDTSEAINTHGVASAMTSHVTSLRYWWLIGPHILKTTSFALATFHFSQIPFDMYTWPRSYMYMGDPSWHTSHVWIRLQAISSKTKTSSILYTGTSSVLQNTTSQERSLSPKSNSWFDKEYWEMLRADGLLTEKSTDKGGLEQRHSCPLYELMLRPDDCFLGKKLWTKYVSKHNTSTQMRHPMAFTDNFW